MELKCQKCGRLFIAYGKRVNTAKYCSSRCYGKSKKGVFSEHLKDICFKKGHTVNAGKKRPDTRLRNLHNNPAWERYGRKNTKINSTINDKGYILIHKPEHPFSDSKGYVREHRLIMEKAIGRYLKSFEVVHHKDGNKQNNEIENLKLFKNQGKHMKYHIIKRQEHE